MELSVADATIQLPPSALARESAAAAFSAVFPEFKFTTLTTCADMKSDVGVGIANANALVIGWQNR